MSILFHRYKKEILILIALILIVVSFSTFITQKQLKDSLSQISFNKLSILKTSLSMHIKEYLAMNEKELIGLSLTSETAQAMENLNSSFTLIDSEYKKEINQTLLKAELNNYVSKIRDNVPNAQPKREVLQYTPKKRSAQIIQNLYISANPFGSNDKHMLYSSEENLSYDKTHKKYHQYFVNELKRYQYYDIFLINPDGDVVYSTSKEHDFATNLKYDIYAESSLAKAYQKALELSEGTVSFSDFRAYEPSYNKPAAFMATPIYKDGAKIGVLAIQLSIHEINKVMTLNEAQKESGLGESGEAYLVGSDFYMRSNSRFTSTLSNPLVDEFSTTVGIIEVNTLSAKRALSGENSELIMKDYRGVEVFSSFAPIEFLDKKWAILVEIDSKEVYAFINNTSKSILVTNIVLTLLFLMLLGYLFLRLILKPMEKQEMLLAKNISLKNKELDSSQAILSEYKKAVDVSSIVSKADTHGIITFVNDPFCEISGYSREELIGKSHSIVRHPDMSREVFKEVWETILRKKVWRGVIKNRKKDGGVYYVNSAIVPILDANNEIKEFISIRSDITELTKIEKQLIKQTTDATTSLPNKQKLFEDIANNKSEMKLAIIQIHKFKDVNDFYSVEIGDLLLISISSILNKLIQNNEASIYKINGDEFAILESKSMPMETFMQKMTNIIKYFDHNVVVIKDDSFNIEVTVGISNGLAQKLYFNSEMSLRKATESSKSLISFEDSHEIEKLYQENIAMTTKIKDAIKNNDIIIFAQPIISNGDKEDKQKYECLVRMRDGDKIISPFFFLDIAKKARLYHTITKIVIEKSFNHFRDSRANFSINLNIEDILDAELVAFLKRKLQEYKIGHRVIIELVESEGIENFEHVAAFIKDVKELGCKIAIDDFGTGYSNFEYLMKLNADFIKIDGSLIKNIDHDENSEIIVTLIVAFAKKMNIKTIGEFIHSDAVYQKVKSMGIDYMQGYYLGEPTAL